MNRDEKQRAKSSLFFYLINWFLAQSSEETPITHLTLQKLLYFVQSWTIALAGRELFSEDCQAWAHGAVYPKVYAVFKQFKYMPLPKVEEKAQFGEMQLSILNMLKKYYGDVDSTKALERICHREELYIKARQGYAEGESCNQLIKKEDIKAYYDMAMKKYKVEWGNLANVQDYLNSLLR